MFSNRRSLASDTELNLESINQKLATLRSLSTKWREVEDSKKKTSIPVDNLSKENNDFDVEDKVIDADLNTNSHNNKVNGFKTIPTKKTTIPVKSNTKTNDDKIPLRKISTPLEKTSKEIPVKKDSKPIKTTKQPAKVANNTSKKKTLRPLMKLKKKPAKKRNTGKKGGSKRYTS